jgi:hypothetical protein
MSDLTQFFGGQPLDATQYEDKGDFGLIPPGAYPAEIKGAEIKTTKAGTGQYVEFTLDLCGDSHAGRKLWHRCNIANPNPVAVNIGKEQLAEMAKACGLLQIRNTDEVVGKFITTKVIVKNDRNEVQRVSSYGTQAPATTARPPSPATTMQPPTPPTVPAPQPGKYGNEIPF